MGRNSLNHPDAFNSLDFPVDSNISNNLLMNCNKVTNKTYNQQCLLTQKEVKRITFKLLLFFMSRLICIASKSGLDLKNTKVYFIYPDVIAYVHNVGLLMIYLCCAVPSLILNR